MDKPKVKEFQIVNALLAAGLGVGPSKKSECFVANDGGYITIKVQKVWEFSQGEAWPVEACLNSLDDAYIDTLRGLEAKGVQFRPSEHGSVAEAIEPVKLFRVQTSTLAVKEAEMGESPVLLLSVDFVAQVSLWEEPKRTLRPLWRTL